MVELQALARAEHTLQQAVKRVQNGKVRKMQGGLFKDEVRCRLEDPLKRISKSADS